MTEEQRRFKVLKRTSYEEQISDEKKLIVLDTFIIGLASAASIYVLSLGASSFQYLDLNTTLLDIGLGVSSTSVGAVHLKDLIQAIAKKTMLESKIEDINTELEAFENEEKRGIGK